MLIIQNLKVFLLCYTLVLIPVLILAFKNREKFWKLFGSVLFPLILGTLLFYNIVSYPSLNWFAIFPSRQGPFQRLPSNGLISLFDNGSAQARAGWVYSLIEIYYQGKTLGVPDEIMKSLNLSQELLKTQGRLVDVVPLEMENELTEGQAELILGMDSVSIKLDDGNIYHFVLEEMDPNSYLLLLKYGNQLFFLPEDLLPLGEGSV